MVQCFITPSNFISQNEISKLYGLSDDETIIIVRKFFKEQMWLVYSEIVGVMKAHLKFFS